VEVLGLASGDPIRLDEKSFTKLADASFDEIDARFTSPHAGLTSLSSIGNNPIDDR
jgi:hypothetical protein